MPSGHNTLMCLADPIINLSEEDDKPMKNMRSKSLSKSYLKNYNKKDTIINNNNDVYNKRNGKNNKNKYIRKHSKKVKSHKRSMKRYNLSDKDTIYSSNYFYPDVSNNDINSRVISQNKLSKKYNSKNKISNEIISKNEISQNINSSMDTSAHDGWPAESSNKLHINNTINADVLKGTVKRVTKSSDNVNDLVSGLFGLKREAIRLERKLGAGCGRVVEECRSCQARCEGLLIFII